MKVSDVYEARVQSIDVQGCQGPQRSSVIGWPKQHAVGVPATTLLLLSSKIPLCVLVCVQETCLYFNDKTYINLNRNHSTTPLIFYPKARSTVAVRLVGHERA